MQKFFKILSDIFSTKTSITFHLNDAPVEIYLWGKQLILPDTNKIIFEYEGKINDINLGYPFFFINGDINSIKHRNYSHYEIMSDKYNIYIKGNVEKSVTTIYGDVRVGNDVLKDVTIFDGSLNTSFVHGNIYNSDIYNNERGYTSYETDLENIQINIPNIHEDNQYVPIWPESFKIKINNETIKFGNKTIDKDYYKYSDIVVNGNITGNISTSNTNIKIEGYIGEDVETTDEDIYVNGVVRGNVSLYIYKPDYVDDW